MSIGEIVTIALAGLAAAFGLVGYWSRRLYGPRAMVLASWWFVLSPNLLAHGALAKPPKHRDAPE